MRSIRRLVRSLLPAVMVIAVVVSLLLFLLIDTPTSQKHHEAHIHHLEQRGLTGPGLSRLALHPRTEAANSHSNAAVTGRSVLLLSQARSGSSLTGNILSHGDSVYYVYEPLRQSEEIMWKEYNRTSAANDSQAAGTLYQNWKDEAKSILHSFFSCDFRGLNLSILDQDFLSKSARTKALARCVEEASGPTPSRSTSTCLEEAEQPCKEAKLKVIKVIRLRVRDIEPLLNSHPELLLILLVRDPLASLFSRIHVFRDKLTNGWSSFIHSNCNQLDDDVSAVMELRHRFPGRIRMVRYETLAEEPVKISRLIYRYIGLEWNSHVENRVRTQTSSAELNLSQSRAIGPFTVMREDSVQAAQAWRKFVDWPFVKKAQEFCFGVMRQLGYTLFRHEADLKDNKTLPYRSEDVLLDDSILLQ